MEVSKIASEGRQLSFVGPSLRENIDPQSLDLGWLMVDRTSDFVWEKFYSLK